MIIGLGGKLKCPDPNTFCAKLNIESDCRRGCSGRGTCENKECKCEDGWTGYDCSQKTYVKTYYYEKA